MKKFLFIICFIVLLNNNAFSDTDCSEIKKLSKEYITCLAKRSKEKTSNLGLDTSNIKEKKYLSDWFKKKK
jgi:hypothetical protein|tara:strand:+ start:29 stop:241 length:213 start_codon:yes stop_codon:yes gene_type:complete